MDGHFTVILPHTMRAVSVSKTSASFPGQIWYASAKKTKTDLMRRESMGFWNGSMARSHANDLHLAPDR